MQCPDGTSLGIYELQQSLLFGRGLHGLLSEAASDIQFSCSHGSSPANVTLTCLGERRKYSLDVMTYYEEWLMVVEPCLLRPKGVFIRLPA